MSSIPIDEKHGVNPSLEICFYCGEDKGVILFGKLKKELREHFEKEGFSEDGRAPRKVVMNHEPCKKCEEFMGQGVILMSVDPKLTDDVRNPYRTGCFAVVREEFITRVFDEEHAKEVLDRRAAFLSDDDWNAMGLPRGDT